VFSHAISRPVEVYEVERSHQYLVRAKYHHGRFIDGGGFGLMQVL
jgi:hypothetical protein